MFLAKVSNPISVPRLLIFLILSILSSVAFAEDSAKKAHLMNNIEIFGKTDLQAIYILMPSGIDDEEIKGSIITRDFSRDPFFMQNIDREEFEMKITLREINGEDEDKKKAAER
jgi:hypothetical protein